MAISLTDLQLSNLDSVISPLDPPDDWVVTDGGSAIRCDVDSMNEELASAPLEGRSAQTLEALQRHQANASSARLI